MKFLALASGITVGFMAVSMTLGGQGAAEPAQSVQSYKIVSKLNLPPVSSQKRAEYTISFYQNYIFSHESGWRTDAVNNSSGACGLGQAWPCSKMPCGLSQADFDCQMTYFNNYCLHRYGSWAAAYDYWVQNHNW